MITSASNPIAQRTPVGSTSTVDVESVQLLACQCGGQGFAMRTDHLAGVHQLTQQQLQQGVDRLETAQGSFPIVSLAEVLSDYFQIRIEDNPEDRSLLAIEVDGQKFALRTGGVSRPVATRVNDFKQLPRIAHPTDSSNVLSSIVVIDRDAELPGDALRLVFDPAAVLGSGTAEPIADAAGSFASTERKQTSTRSSGVDARSGHLLAFMPSDIATVENFIFALPLATVVEVTTEHQVMPVSMASDQLEGFIYWRRRPVPVIRLGHSFGMAGDADSFSGQSNQDRRLVVARTAGGRPVAFYAHTAIQSIRVPSAEAVQPDSLQGAPMVGAFKTDMGVLVVPDLVSILDGKSSTSAQ